jgi:prepilin-type N-terminal cleavage/methylation domain-containing protein/prepilin-type processing-associated H-X9-DG protein
MNRCKAYAKRNGSKDGFTLVELLVVISIIALLMAVLMPALAKAREQGKRVNCMSNLKQLTLGWLTYTEANNDKIVNGAPQGSGTCLDCPAGPGNTTAAVAPTNPSDEHYRELPWIGNAYGAIDDCYKKCAITTGALWRYVKNDKIYRCPTGNKGELITYTAVDGVNGLTASRGTGASTALLKNRNQIKRTATQLVYVDEGKVTPDSYAVNIDKPLWFDPPMVRHSNGTVVSFADGHSECWKWKSKKTMDFGKLCETAPQYNVFPGSVPSHPEMTQDNDDMQDLYLMQMRCWSRLSSTYPISSYPPKID